MTRRVGIVATLIIAAGALQSCHSARKHPDEAQSGFCDLHVCNTEFDALHFAGMGPLVIRLSGGNFYRLDSRTSDQINDRLKYLREEPDESVTAYSGTVDGMFVWSKPIQAPVFWITRMQSVRRLGPSDKAKVLQAFER